MENKDDIPFSVFADMEDADYDMKISVIETKQSKEKMQESDLGRMQLAIKSLNAGTWTMDVSTNSLIICDRCKEIIPICNEGHVKINRLRDFIPSVYGKKVVEVFLLALKTGSPFDLEVPIEVPMSAVKDSPLKWLRITGTATFNNRNYVQKLHGMVEDISERKNSELLKQDFLPMVSHDLRSPLSVIKLYMQMCDQLAGDIGNHRISEMLKKAGLQVDKINRMIRCYLDSAAIGTKELCHSPVSFDIKELLKEAISDLYLLYPGHILFLKPGPSMEVHADRDKIAQVIQNLLINAIKYSSHADIITVHFRKMGNCLQVTVEDHGIGIRPADQEKIFDRFYRVERKKEMPLMGYGIGLYLSKEIIKQHEGNIWLKSEVNKGSKFYFTLPLS